MRFFGFGAVFIIGAMSIQAAVVLAAGKGTRMKSRVPKVLHRICGKSMIGLIVDAVSDAGLGVPLVVVPSDSHSIQNDLGENVSYATQDLPVGTGQALLEAKQSLDGVDNIVVLYGDMPLVSSETLNKMIKIHIDNQACITLLTSEVENPDGFGRIIRDNSGKIQEIIEDIEADEHTLSINEVNGGVYCFESSWLWTNLDNLAPSKYGERYLTDLISTAYDQSMMIDSIQVSNPIEILGVNTRKQLLTAQNELRQLILNRLMLSGVTLVDDASVYVDYDVSIGADTILHPNTHVTGTSQIGEHCDIGPNSVVTNSIVGDKCKVSASFVEGSVLEEGTHVGPFSHIRPGTHLEEGVYVGNFAEVNRSRLGVGTKMGHYSYVGDADVGVNVNIGAGTVTCNFDGNEKHTTTIGNDVFIGSGSMLVAPVTIGDRSSTGAGSVVTKDVPPDTQVLGVPAKGFSKKDGNR